MFGSSKTMFRSTKTSVKKSRTSTSNNNTMYTNSNTRPNSSPSPTRKKLITTQTTESSSSSTPSSSNNNNVENWPPSLKEFVNRTFSSCTDGNREMVAEEMRKIIFDSFSNGKLWSTDWDSMSLPNLTETKKRKKSPISILDNIEFSRKKISLSDSNSSNLSMTEIEQRQKRLQRFQREQKKYGPPVKRPDHEVDNLGYSNVNTGDVIDWDEYTVVGTSTKLEKPYLRLTSAPDPATVRTLSTLRKTLEHLINKHKEHANYTFLCDQFKSLRQDLTVQRIKNEFTIRVYETHARIALENGDLGEYNQCASQLRQLYTIKKSLNENYININEFLAYRILYLLHTRDRPGINSIMVELGPNHYKDNAISHAMKVRSAIATGNYHKLFQLYRNVPNYGIYLMEKFIDRERCTAIYMMCKGFRPDLPLSYIEKELAFKDMNECLFFLKECGGNKFLIYKENQQGNYYNDGSKKYSRKEKMKSYYIDTKIALGYFKEKLVEFNKVDIKGQI